FRQRHDLAFALPIPETDMRAAGKRSSFNLFLSAEPEQLRARTSRQSSGGGVVGIQDGEVILTLIFEDALLGVDVIVESLVAIEMVGRDVENHCDSRPKFNDGFQLKT